jgi:hypothetical protein
VSGTYRPSSRERANFVVLRRRLTPKAADHRAYLRDVARYIAECRTAPPRLAHDGRIGHVTRLEVWRSRLFRRRYLVACVDASWYRAAAPASDAITSTVSGVGALPPLVIVPHVPARRRSEHFRSIIEHEFVHINQAILGMLLPAARGPAAHRLANAFFTRCRSEFEAHLLQATRWPGVFPHGLGLSLEHWCVLRGYTDALESVFLATFRREFQPRDLVGFLDRLPGRLRGWLKELRLDRTLVFWFRRHLVLHVAVALLNLARTHTGFGRSAVFRAGHAWVGARGSSRRGHRAAPSLGVIAVPRSPGGRLLVVE